MVKWAARRSSAWLNVTPDERVRPGEHPRGSQVWCWASAAARPFGVRDICFPAAIRDSVYGDSTILGAEWRGWIEARTDQIGPSDRAWASVGADDGCPGGGTKAEIRGFGEPFRRQRQTFPAPR